MSTQLKPYNVVICRFDPSKGVDAGEDFALPVDSPDEEHAIASTMANAASFSTKFSNGQVLPVAFICKGVSLRS